MVIEVYGVKQKHWTEGAGISKVPENRRLVELTGARLRPWQKENDKCEITLPNGVQIICAGTYDEIVERIIAAQNSGMITRVTKDN